LRHNPKRFENLKPGDEIPVVDNPEEILVVVAGGMGRHSVVVPTFGGHTRAVTMPIVGPDGGYVRAES